MVGASRSLTVGMLGPMGALGGGAVRGVGGWAAEAAGFHSLPPQLLPRRRLRLLLLLLWLLLQLLLLLLLPRLRLRLLRLLLRMRLLLAGLEKRMLAMVGKLMRKPQE
ncbi:hypothetical protein T492DRAFT_858613, partial [Pavlovales sp. CCMP2436]